MEKKGESMNTTYICFNCKRVSHVSLNTHTGLKTDKNGKAVFNKFDCKCGHKCYDIARIVAMLVKDNKKVLRMLV